jgi:hypothetical protein
MEWFRYIFVGVFFLGTICLANSSHLLLFSSGEGAISEIEGEKQTLKVASFLPFGKEILAQPDSGLETMSAGYTFRFGHNTRFSFSDKGTHIKSGMMMIQSRKIDNSCKVFVGDSSFSFSGAGTCTIEYDGENKIWITGILGRFRFIKSPQEGSYELMPGDLISFGINGGQESSRASLKEIITSSFLFTGFKNNKSFQNSLEKVATQQEIDLQLNNESGSKKPTTNPQNLVNDPVQMVSETNATARQEYLIPELDPLSELLGRAPRRFGENAITPISKESSAKLGELVAPAEMPALSAEDEVYDEVKARPFPSRLLRKNKIEK